MCVCLCLSHVDKKNNSPCEPERFHVGTGFSDKKKKLKSAFLTFYFAEFAIHQRPPMVGFVIYKSSYSVVLGFGTNPNTLTTFTKPFFSIYLFHLIILKFDHF